MRLIDADALKENMFFHEIDNESYAEEKDIDNTPTIDAVQVVRCKDCKFHEQEEPGMVYCSATVAGWVEENWFCKGGERREDAETL